MICGAHLEKQDYLDGLTWEKNEGGAGVDCAGWHRGEASHGLASQGGDTLDLVPYGIRQEVVWA